jgi:hypothetical protein
MCVIDADPSGHSLDLIGHDHVRGMRALQAGRVEEGRRDLERIASGDAWRWCPYDVGDPDGLRVRARALLGRPR